MAKGRKGGIKGKVLGISTKTIMIGALAIGAVGVGFHFYRKRNKQAMRGKVLRRALAANAKPTWAAPTGGWKGRPTWLRSTRPYGPAYGKFEQKPPMYQHRRPSVG